MQPSLYKSVREMIRTLREEYSLSQTEIAHLTGLSESTISRIINGLNPETIVLGMVLFLGLSYLLKKIPPPSKAEEEEKRRRHKELKGLTGKHLQQMRIDMGLTQIQLAAELGVSKSALCRWEQGTVKIEYLPIITLAMLQVKYELEQQQVVDVLGTLRPEIVRQAQQELERNPKPLKKSVEDRAYALLDELMAEFA